MRLLAQAEDIFGSPIKAPGPEGLNSGSVGESFARLVTFGINMVFIVAGIIMLVYLLWGSLNWVVAGGDADKIESARNQIVQAIVGILLIVVVLALWLFIAVNIIGTVEMGDDGFQFKLPTIENTSGGSGGNGGGDGGPGTGGGGGDKETEFSPF